MGIMKYATVCALIGTISALRYAESEGPTKVDYGEDDPNVLPRENDYDGTGDYAWTNPLSVTDDGLADETVLTMLDGQLVSGFNNIDQDEYDTEGVTLVMLKGNGMDEYQKMQATGEQPDRPKYELSKLYIEGEGHRFPRSFWTSSFGYASPDIQTNMPWVAVAKYDHDGDGVEDNEQLSADEIDTFYNPNVFNTAEEIYNTHHGELPGHALKILHHGPPDDISPWEVAEAEGRKNINEITDQGMNSDSWVSDQ